MGKIFITVGFVPTNIKIPPLCHNILLEKSAFELRKGLDEFKGFSFLNTSEKSQTVEISRKQKHYTLKVNHFSGNFLIVLLCLVKTFVPLILSRSRSQKMFL